jgi:serine/threonine protein kinase
MELAPGTVVDRFVVDAIIGRGGMASVYRVKHARLGTLHALKVLAVPNTSVQGRLLLEGRVQAQLAHPNVLNVTDILDVSGAPGLLMEYVRGPSLDRILDRSLAWDPRGKLLTLALVDQLLPGILAGVGAAHALGVVHRDLKPANILLALEGGRIVPKVADFGLVKLFGDEQGRLTRTGATMGTPEYMSPEQIRSSREVDTRTDIFALGAVLYELVTGEPAFSAEGAYEIFGKITRGDYVPPREIRPELPDRVVSAIEAALVIEAAARVPSVGELWRLWAGPGAPSLQEAADRRQTADPELVARLESLGPHGQETAPSTLPSTTPPPGKTGATHGALSDPTAHELASQAPPSQGNLRGALAFTAATGVGCGALVLGAVVLVGVGVMLGRSASRQQPVPEPVPVSAPAPEPVPVPVPVPVPEPAPVPEPVPVPVPAAPIERPATRPLPPPPPPPVPVEAPPSTPMGTFSVVGTADSVRLLPASGGAALRPGLVPAGKYKVEATFGGKVLLVGDVEVQADQRVLWRCESVIRSCGPAGG